MFVLQTLRRTLVLSATACLLGQCHKENPAGATAKAPLATVAGRPIHEADLLQEAEWRKANHQPVPAAPELLKEMVDRLALVEQARQAGLAEEPATKRRIESVLIARLREQQLDAGLAKIGVTDEELAAAYESRRDEFSQAALDRFSILFQAVDAKASEARRNEARQRLEAGLARAAAAPATGGRGPAASGFGAVAVEFSDDQVSRHRGGDIGWLTDAAEGARVPAEVLKEGRALKKGTSSGVIESEQGYYAIMKTDSRPGGARPLDEVAGDLRHKLLQEKRRAMEEAFLANALESAAVTLDLTAAGQVKLPHFRPSRPSENVPPSLPAAAR